MNRRILHECEFLITRYVMVMRMIESYRKELLDIEKQFNDYVKGAIEHENK